MREPLGGSEDERLRRGPLGALSVKLFGRDRRRLIRKPARKMIAIIAKLEQIPIAALLPSVRPVGTLGAAPNPDTVELSSELKDVAAAGDEELDMVVFNADGLSLDSVVWSPASPDSSCERLAERSRRMKD